MRIIIKLWQIIDFVLFLTWQTIVSTLRVAWDVLSPKNYKRPGVIAVPLDVRSDVAITVLTTMISLTPGSVSLDISSDRQVLYIHGMFINDPVAYRREIKEKFERRVLELLRWT